MKNSVVRSAMFTLVIFLGLSAFCGKDVLAKGIPIPFLFNTGSEIYPVAPIPDELAAMSDDPDIVNWKLGYKCQHFGIFYADIWCWSEELVIFKGKTYSDIPEEIKRELEKKYPFSKAERSIWNKYGILITLLLIVLAIGARVMLEKDPENPDYPDHDVQNRGGQQEYEKPPMHGDDGSACPKCGAERQPGDAECLKCGIIYSKYRG